MRSNEVTWTPFLLGVTNAEGAHISGEWWVRSSQVVTALGLKDSAVRMAIKRNPDLLGPEHETMVPIPTDSGVQMTRVFSFAGIVRLTTVITTEQARTVLLQIVEDYEMGGRLRPRHPALSEPGSFPMSADTLRAFNAVRAELEPDHPAQRTIQAMMIGALPLPPDPMLDAAVDEYIDGGRMKAVGAHRQAEARKRVARFHYSDDALRAEVRRRARTMLASNEQPSLTFDLGSDHVG
jgi:hypothetical protein